MPSCLGASESFDNRHTKRGPNRGDRTDFRSDYPFQLFIGFSIDDRYDIIGPVARMDFDYLGNLLYRRIYLVLLSHIGIHQNNCFRQILGVTLIFLSSLRKFSVGYNPFLNYALCWPIF